MTNKCVNCGCYIETIKIKDCTRCGCDEWFVSANYCNFEYFGEVTIVITCGNCGASHTNIVSTSTG